MSQKSVFTIVLDELLRLLLGLAWLLVFEDTKLILCDAGA